MAANNVIYKRSAITNNDCTPWCLDLFTDLVIPYLNNKYNKEIIQMIITEYKNFCSELSNMKKVKDLPNGFILKSENVEYTTNVDNSQISETFIVEGCPIITITYNLYDETREEFEEEHEDDNISITFDRITIKLI